MVRSSQITVMLNMDTHTLTHTHMHMHTVSSAVDFVGRNVSKKLLVFL